MQNGKYFLAKNVKNPFVFDELTISMFDIGKIHGLQMLKFFPHTGIYIYINFS